MRRSQLEHARQQLVQAAATLRPEEGRSDSWSHYQRRASALAEVFAVALGRRSDAADLLTLARELPKGFAGFRAPSALTLAEVTRIVAPGDNAARDAALTSAAAASHRIQDYRFCLQMTAMVNAMRFRWKDMTGADLQATVSRFLEKPLAAEFCAIHRVLEQFEYRAEDQQYFQALPIPETVRHARTLREIAAIFDYKPEELVAVNDWIWAEPDAPDAIHTEVLQKDEEVRIPDPDFVPILASRFAAEVLVADGVVAGDSHETDPAAGADGAAKPHGSRYRARPPDALHAGFATETAAEAQRSEATRMGYRILGTGRAAHERDVMAAFEKSIEFVFDELG